MHKTSLQSKHHWLLKIRHLLFILKSLKFYRWRERIALQISMMLIKMGEGSDYTLKCEKISLRASRAQINSSGITAHWLLDGFYSNASTSPIKYTRWSNECIHVTWNCLGTDNGHGMWDSQGLTQASYANRLFIFQVEALSMNFQKPVSPPLPWNPSIIFLIILPITEKISTD